MNSVNSLRKKKTIKRKKLNKLYIKHLNGQEKQIFLPVYFVKSRKNTSYYFNYSIFYL